MFVGLSAADLPTLIFSLCNLKFFYVPTCQPADLYFLTMCRPTNYYVTVYINNCYRYITLMPELLFTKDRTTFMYFREGNSAISNSTYLRYFLARYYLQFLKKKMTSFIRYGFFGEIYFTVFSCVYAFIFNTYFKFKPPKY